MFTRTMIRDFDKHKTSSSPDCSLKILSERTTSETRKHAQHVSSVLGKIMTRVERLKMKKVNTN